MPSGLLFAHPTPAALTAFIAAELRDAAPAETRPEVRGRADEPVAIVGIACRFPGGVSSPEELWRLVVMGGFILYQNRGVFVPDPVVAKETTTVVGH